MDRGRETISNGHWDSPGELIRSVAYGFQYDKWINQPVCVEVMCEKQALEGVLERVCSGLDVPFSSNKGYASQSFLWRKAQEYIDVVRSERTVKILYLGDFDPSGLDMDRDVIERLRLFMPGREDCISLDRIALTKEQIDTYSPPPNPTKITDSRAEKYIKEHGDSSWELDALEPRVISELIKSHVIEVRDEINWNAMVVKEEEAKLSLEVLADSYEEEM